MCCIKWHIWTYLGKDSFSCASISCTVWAPQTGQSAPQCPLQLEEQSWPETCSDKTGRREDWMVNVGVSTWRTHCSEDWDGLICRKEVQCQTCIHKRFIKWRESSGGSKKKTVSWKHLPFYEILYFLQWEKQFKKVVYRLKRLLCSVISICWPMHCGLLSFHF